jgi:magnesium-transporting ATPase (P-type)
LLLTLDTTFFNQAQSLFYNFSSSSVYPLFMARSAPSKTVTKAIPNGNLFGPVNQIRFWGSLIIATGGLVAGYLYFRTTA